MNSDIAPQVARGTFFDVLTESLNVFSEGDSRVTLLACSGASPVVQFALAEGQQADDESDSGDSCAGGITESTYSERTVAVLKEQLGVPGSAIVPMSSLAKRAAEATVPSDSGREGHNRMRVTNMGGTSAVTRRENELSKYDTISARTVCAVVEEFIAGADVKSLLPRLFMILSNEEKAVLTSLLDDALLEETLPEMAQRRNSAIVLLKMRAKYHTQQTGTSPEQSSLPHNANLPASNISESSFSSFHSNEDTPLRSSLGNKVKIPIRAPKLSRGVSLSSDFSDLQPSAVREQSTEPVPSQDGRLHSTEHTPSQDGRLHSNDSSKSNSVDGPSLPPMLRRNSTRRKSVLSLPLGPLGALEVPTQRRITSFTMGTSVQETKTLESVNPSTYSELLDYMISPHHQGENGDVYSSGHGVTLTWQGEFTRLVEVSASDPLNEHKTIAVGNFVSDFTRCAQMYGRVIAAERHIKYRYKSIKPYKAMGGLAGGDKYIAGGIFFKFSTDDHGLYGGSDYYASKASRHDLRVLSMIYDAKISGLNTPLTCVIDCKGVSVLAQALLPVNGQKTLVYGSCDGGRTVVSSDETAQKMMSELGRAFNLASHECGGVQMALCGDIELHKAEGRYYLLDVARVMPPEPPPPNSDGGLADVLSCHLRPELVAQWKVPLCSDAYTMFDEDALRRELHKEDLKQCVEFLLTEEVPRFAKKLESTSLSNDISLSHEMHKKGINMRHLKAVYDNLTKDEWKKIVMAEMAARSHKEIVLSMFSIMDARLTGGLPVEDPLVRLFVTYVKSISDPQKGLGEFLWREAGMLAASKFRTGSQDGLQHMYEHIHWGLFLKQLIRMCGVQFRQAALNEVFKSEELESSTILELHDGNISGLSARVHVMTIIDISVGIKMFRQARMSDDPRLRLGYLKDSIMSLQILSHASQGLNSLYLPRVYLHAAITCVEAYRASGGKGGESGKELLHQMEHYFNQARSQLASYIAACKTSRCGRAKTPARTSSVRNFKAVVDASTNPVDALPSELWRDWCTMEFWYHALHQHTSQDLGGLTYVDSVAQMDIDRYEYLMKFSPRIKNNTKSSTDGINHKGYLFAEVASEELYAKIRLFAEISFSKRSAAIGKDMEDKRGALNSMFIAIRSLSELGCKRVVLTEAVQLIMYFNNYTVPMPHGMLLPEIVEFYERAFMAASVAASTKFDEKALKLTPGWIPPLMIGVCLPLLSVMSGKHLVASHMCEQVDRIEDKGSGFFKSLVLIVQVHYFAFAENFKQASEIKATLKAMDQVSPSPMITHQVNCLERVVGIVEGSYCALEMLEFMQAGKNAMNENIWWYLMIKHYRISRAFDPIHAQRMIDAFVEWSERTVNDTFKHFLNLEQAYCSLKKVLRGVHREHLGSLCCEESQSTIDNLLDTLAKLITDIGSAENAGFFYASHLMQLLAAHMINAVVDYCDKSIQEMKSSSLKGNALASPEYAGIPAYSMIKEEERSAAANIFRRTLALLKEKAQLTKSWKKFPDSNIEVVENDANSIVAVTTLGTTIYNLGLSLNMMALDFAEEMGVDTEAENALWCGNDVLRIRNADLRIAARGDPGPISRMISGNEMFSSRASIATSDGGQGGQDHGCLSLANILQQHAKGVSMGTFFNFAIEVVRCLGMMHQRGVLHRDIQPANWLTDGTRFFLQETDSACKLGLAGSRYAMSYMYSAPEILHSSKMNMLSSIGFESDLYSVGVCFFEMLTGKPPFPETVPTRLIHAHRSTIPPKVSEIRPNVPAILSDMVAILLNKDPSDRYRSAYSLHADLCAIRDQSSSTDGTFVLRSHKKPSQMVASSTVYGREAELQMLQHAYDRISKKGTTHLSYIEATSGAGKTSLIEAFLAAKKKDETCLVLIRGKFEMGYTTPYEAIAVGFADMLTKVSKDPAIGLLFRRVMPMLCEDITLIGQVAPEFSKNSLFTEAAQMASTRRSNAPAGNEQARQRYAFCNVLQEMSAFAKIIVHIDDLQWADPSSLALIEQFMRMTSFSIMLIVTSRPLSDDTKRVVRHSIEHIREEHGSRFMDFPLGNLDSSAANSLIADMLCLESKEVVTLSSMLNSLTGGLPLFLKQAINQLYEDNKLAFSFAEGRFKWKSSSELLLESEIPSVLNILSRKIQNLSETYPDMKYLLVAMAQVGNSAAAPMLGLILELPMIVVGNCLQAAASQGLVCIEDDGTVDFAHDKVQEALLQIVAEKIPKDSPCVNPMLLVEGLLDSCHKNRRAYYSKEILDAACGLGGATETDMDTDSNPLIVDLPKRSAIDFQDVGLDDFDASMLNRYGYDILQHVGTGASMKILSPAKIMFFTKLAHRQAKNAVASGAHDKAHGILLEAFSLLVKFDNKDKVLFDTSTRDDVSERSGSSSMDYERSQQFSSRFELPDALWEQYRDLILDMLTLLFHAEFCIHSVHMTKVIFEAILKHCTDEQRLVKTYRMNGELLLSQNQFQEAIDNNLTCVKRIFNIDLPTSPPQDMVEHHMKLVDEKMHHLLDANDFMKIPEASSDDWREGALCGTIIDIAPACYNTANIPLYIVLNSIPIIRSLEYGRTEASMLGLCFFGFTLSAVFQRFDEGARMALVGKELSDKYGSAFVKSVTYIMTVPASQYITPPDNLLRMESAATTFALHSANVVFMAFSPMNEVWLMMTVSRSLNDLMKSCHKAMQQLDEVNDQVARWVVKSVHYGATLMASPMGSRLSGASLKETVKQFNFPMITYAHLVYSLMMPAYMLEKYSEGLAALYQHYDSVKLYSPMAAFHDLDFFRCLLLLKQYTGEATFEQILEEEERSPESRNEERDTLMKQIREAAAIVEKQASTVPSPIYAPRWSLLQGAIAAAEGDHMSAILKYDQCNREAAQHKLYFLAVIASEKTSESYDALGMKEAALGSLVKADQIAKRWGAAPKRLLIKEKIDLLAVDGDPWKCVGQQSHHQRTTSPVSPTHQSFNPYEFGAADSTGIGSEDDATSVRSGRSANRISDKDSTEISATPTHVADHRRVRSSVI